MTITALILFFLIAYGAYWASGQWGPLAAK